MSLFKQYKITKYKNIFNKKIDALINKYFDSIKILSLIRYGKSIINIWMQANLYMMGG